jgi:hypothetical protein
VLGLEQLAKWPRLAGVLFLEQIVETISRMSAKQTGTILVQMMSISIKKRFPGKWSFIKKATCRRVPEHSVGKPRSQAFHLVVGRSPFV